MVFGGRILWNLRHWFVGEPNMVGRDGSVPIMVCLVPLINKDPLHSFTHNMKVSFNNCFGTQKLNKHALVLIISWIVQFLKIFCT